MSALRTVTLPLPSPAATIALAERLSPLLRIGDVIGLAGPIGAGKSLFARALIQHRLAALGRHEDVPSPSFTLVQTYDAGDAEIWHSDLYRLTHPEEALELGLDTAFEDAICLVEWPDRLGDAFPRSAMLLTLTPEADGDARIAELRWSAPRWDRDIPRLQETADAE